jgi:hypothetical protein
MSEFLGVERKTVYRLSDPTQTTAVLPHFRIGKKMKYRVDSPEMQQWIQRQLIQSLPTEEHASQTEGQK